jgi:hypothetical protein
MARIVVRSQSAFWRLWDRARASGAEVTPGTVRLNWSVSRGSRNPCLAPRWSARIIGARNTELVRRKRQPSTIHRVRLKGGVIDYPIPGGEVVRIAEGVQVTPEQTLGAIEVWARCRACEACREHVRQLWVARAVAELRLCRGRSWFVTLTVRPVQRDLILYQAIQQAKNRSVNWHELPAEDRSKRLFRTFYAEVQKYLKRVREELRVKGKRRLRFLCTVEPHKDGFPHAHLLIHEESFADANERVLRNKWWRMGQAKVRLVRNSQDAALYVSKYVAKDAGIIRGSKLYGRSEPVSVLDLK